ncbi:oligosaccharide flippase family protein [Marinobacter sp. NFXS9]|uniref:lipopolysaccharide biosynthesis protein n=1 Tax=Marinobacter sp. NFXS9 TaxID=2818433 RepID=UPI0032DF878E
MNKRNQKFRRAPKIGFAFGLMAKILKGPIALGTIRTGMVLGLRLLLQAGNLLLVARMLGPDFFGIFAGIAALAVLLGTLSTFGTQLVLLGEVSKDPRNRDGVLSYAIPTTMLFAGFMLLLYLGLMLFWLSEDEVTWPVVLAIGLAEIVLQPLFGLMSTEHHALGRVARAQLLQNGPLVLRLIMAVIIFYFELSPVLDIYAVGYLLASIIVLLLGACCLPKRWPGCRCWHMPSNDQWSRAFGYAAVNISKAGPAELDKTLAAKLLAMDVAGVYAAAARVVGAITLPVTALTLSALPRLFRENAEQHFGSWRLLKWMYSLALLYALILSAVLWIFAPILGELFGRQYAGIGDIIRWFCLAPPGIAVRLIAGNVLMATGKPWFRVGFEVIGLGLLVLVGIWLAPNFGAKGMALAVVCSEWGMAAVGSVLIILVSRAGISPNSKA